MEKLLKALLLLGVAILSSSAFAMSIRNVSREAIPSYSSADLLTQDNRDFITIALPDGEPSVTVAPSVAHQCTTLSDCMKFPQTPQQSVTTIAFEKGSPATAYKLSSIFKCMKYPKTIESLSPQQVRSLLVLADYIQAPHNVLTDLAHRMKNSAANKNDKKFAHSFLNTITPALAQHVSVDNGYLDLSNRQLDSLDGLENLKGGKNVHYLDFSGNNIKFAHIDKVFSQFPNLKGLSLENNALEEITCSKIPYGSYVGLARNQLKQIPAGAFSSYNATVDLSGNKLSPEQCDLLKKNLKIPFMQKHRDKIEAFNDPQLKVARNCVSFSNVAMLSTPLLISLLIDPFSYVKPSIFYTNYLLPTIKSNYSDPSIMFIVGVGLVATWSRFVLDFKNVYNQMHKVNNTNLKTDNQHYCVSLDSIQVKDRLKTALKINEIVGLQNAIIKAKNN